LDGATRTAPSYAELKTEVEGLRPALGEALDAVYPLARDRLAFPELEADGLLPHAVKAVWLFASSRATAYVDIASTFERKLAARLAHESQTVDPVALAECWRLSAATVGGRVKLAVAEAFTVLTLS
jgi:hypothetical protein